MRPTVVRRPRSSGTDRVATTAENTGYLDRVGVYELLRMTPEIKRLIVERASQDDLRDQAQAQGMRTLCDEAIKLVDQGSTTISEVVRGIYTANI